MQKIFNGRVFVLLLWVVIISLSGSTFTINNGDYFRTTNTFLGNIAFQDPYMPLNWLMKAHFKPLWDLNEFSVYSMLIYAYASVISLLTSWFDIMLMASLLKLLYLAELFILSKVFLTFKKLHHFLLFIILIIPLCSSSILAFLASFYQDGIVIVILPLLCYVLCKPVRYQATAIFLLVTTISCTKTQFFYLPALIILTLLCFSKQNNKKQYIAMFASLLLSVIFLTSSGNSVILNKYNSNYFGAYLYQKMNNIELASDVDAACVGIDPWSQKYDFDLGGTSLALPASSCYLRHRSQVSFIKSLKVFASRPLDLMTLPFSPSIQKQMTEDYFNIAYNKKYVYSHDVFISAVTRIKDEVFSPWRFIIALLIGIASLSIRRHPQAKLLFILGGFASSQFYICFFGEGYRDLSRHLFAMNFSFDLMIFVSLMMLISAALKWQKSRGYINENLPAESLP